MPYTLGPWYVFRGYDGGETIAIMRTRKIHLSVNASKQWVTDEHGRVKTESELEAESEANAPVMAASPELLASVLEFVALYDSAMDMISGGVKAKVERARAAIAKAEGR